MLPRTCIILCFQKLFFFFNCPANLLPSTNGKWIRKNKSTSLNAEFVCKNQTAPSHCWPLGGQINSGVHIGMWSSSCDTEFSTSAWDLTFWSAHLIFISISTIRPKTHSGRTVSPQVILFPTSKLQLPQTFKYWREKLDTFIRKWCWGGAVGVKGGGGSIFTFPVFFSESSWKMYHLLLQGEIKAARKMSATSS